MVNSIRAWSPVSRPKVERLAMVTGHDRTRSFRFDKRGRYAPRLLVRLGVAFVAVVAACALLWAWSPLPTSGQSLNQLDGKIGSTRAKIGRKKGTERGLGSDIAAYTRRTDPPQVRISTLQRRETVLQVDLAAKRAELERIRGRLRTERARLVRLRARLVVTRHALAQRLVDLYQADRPDLVTVVLNANGFAQLLEQHE